MYKNPFEQLEDSRLILSVYAAQLVAGRGERVLSDAKELGQLLQLIVANIQDALEASEELDAAPPYMPSDTHKSALQVHEPEAGYQID